jgi:capsular polysaccharide transport system permease protein
MIDKLKQSWPAQLTARLATWTQDWLTPTLLRRRTLGAAVIASLIAIVYWGVIASSRYVSEAHVVVQRTDMGLTSGIDLGGLLGSGTSPSHSEQVLLRDHLLSSMPS